MKFLKQKVGTGFIFFMIFMIFLFVITFLWKPWGFTVFYGFLGIFFLRAATVFWRKAKMIYVSISYAIFAIVSLVLFVQSLIMHNVSWSWIVVPAPFVMLILMEIEERKNPEKMKKWELARKNVSFFKLLWFHIPELEDKEKPEKKEG